tara:strand:- start:13686 stop:15395 length:1710 start_codon:yes stop_codon:yes gene_type:complete
MINGNKKFFYEKLKLIKKNPEKNFLGATFNHRSFSLLDKSTIKRELEFLNINHLMFSIRPSAKDILKKNFGKNFSYYKNFLQLYFCIILSIKYGITKIVIDNDIKDKLNLSEDLNYYFQKNLREISKKINISNKKLIFFNLINLNNFDLDKIKIEILKCNLEYKKKINKFPKREKDIFWLGFDDNFKKVPHNKVDKRDNWYFKKVKSKIGEPLFKNLKYCSRCCLPETSEGIKFDDYGVCTICRSSEEKMNINWDKREKILKGIFLNYKKKGNYDCLLPISGGKDSMFQSYKLKNTYNLNPLTVTHSQNWLSTIGRYNLENCLRQFDLDHLNFIPNRKIINKVAKKSVHKIGDACWHCHIGAGSISIQTSVAWNVKLIVFGEAPADTDARGQHKKISEVSPYRFLKESAIEKHSSFIDKDIKKKDLSHWIFPSKEEVKKKNVKVIHLGQYLFWDEHKNIDLVSKEFGWKSGPVENTYKTYKSVECVMAGVHDYFNFIKRGIGRATVHASEDVRRGLINREEGFELAKKFDIQKPQALEFYKKITNLSDRQIIKSLKYSRNKSKYASKLK